MNIVCLQCIGSPVLRQGGCRHSLNRAPVPSLYNSLSSVFFHILALSFGKGPHIAHHAIHSKRENLYPGISIRSIQMYLDWIGLFYGTRFSELITEENNQFGTGYVYLP